MAWALTKLKEVQRDPDGHFCAVFLGVPFVKATFYQQLDAFFGSTIQEMEHCHTLNHGAGGLWMDW
jgi:hypothetical protein